MQRGQQLTYEVAQVGAVARYGVWRPRPRLSALGRGCCRLGEEWRGSEVQVRGSHVVSSLSVSGLPACRPGPFGILYEGPCGSDVGPAMVRMQSVVSYQGTFPRHPTNDM
jgi:hypothetical protein